MNTTLLIIAVAAVGGVAITIQGQFAGLLDKSLGTRGSVFITYATGGLLITLIALAGRAVGLTHWRTVPWYAYTSGLLGLVIVGAISYSVPRLGLSKAFTVIVAAQFIVSALIDHFGLLGAAMRPLQPGQLAGMGLLVVSVWLVLR